MSVYHQDFNKPPFKEQELVVCVDALPGANVENGKLYRIYSVRFSQADDGEYYWYVGVCESVGEKIITHNGIRPSIFRNLTQAEKQPYVLKLVYGDQT